jgi:hypothetical protein
LVERTALTLLSQPKYSTTCRKLFAQKYIEKAIKPKPF